MLDGLQLKKRVAGRSRCREATKADQDAFTIDPELAKSFEEVRVPFRPSTVPTTGTTNPPMCSASVQYFIL